MTKEEITKIFNDFRAEYDFEKHAQVWRNQGEEFRRFWSEKIMDDKSILLEEDMDYFIRFFDMNARGAGEFRENGGESAALAGIWQGMWYRALKAIKEKSDIKKILDRILNTEESEIRVDLVNKLWEVNQGGKNGLTGEKAIILGALLFVYSPNKYLSMLSVNHRLALIDFLEIGNSTQYKSYGEQVIKTHDDIISGFKNKYDINIEPRALSYFVYEWLDKYYQWKGKAIGEEMEINEEESEDEQIITDSSVIDKNSFVLEKHLEDFLIANWEATELGKLYDLIEEDGDIVSQQYLTKDIGNIDLLVIEKRSGNYVVIELKKGKTSDQAIGQLTRYMGWVKRNKADGKKVKGIIIAGGQDERLKYAIDMVPDAEIFIYRINFILERPEEK